MRKLFWIISLLFCFSLKAIDTTSLSLEEGENWSVIKTVVSEEGNRRIYRKELLFWENGNITSRSLLDSQGKIEALYLYRYDQSNRVIEETFIGNLTGKQEDVVIEIDDKGNPLDRGSLESFTTQYIYDEEGRLIEKREGVEKGENQRVVQFIYENDLLKAELTGNKEEIFIRRFYEHDQKMRITKIIVDNGYHKEKDYLEGVTERRITRFSYQGENELPEMIEEGYFDFYLNQMIVTKTVLNTFDEKGNILSQEHFDAFSAEKLAIFKTYDSEGNLQVVREESEQGVRETHYDKNRNIVENITEESREYYFYNENQQVIGFKKVLHDGQVFSLSYSYDSSGNLKKSIDAFGNETLYFYDSLGRLIGCRLPKVLDKEDRPVSYFLKKTYDISNRPVEVYDGEKHMSVTLYTAWGRPLSISYPDGSKEEFSYTLDGLLEKEVARDGSIKTYQYDCLGNVIAYRWESKEGKLIDSKEASHNGFHCVCVKDRSGAITSFDYDFSGSVVKVLKDSERGIIDFDIPKERPKELKEGLQKQEGVEVHYRYDAVNALGKRALEKIVVKDGNIIESTIYDALLRPETIIQKDCLGNILTRKEMRYDSVGKKVLERHFIFSQDGQEQVKETFFDYDSMGNLIRVYDRERSTVFSYKYDINKNRIEMSKPDGTVIYYSYDHFNRLISLKSSDDTIYYVYHYDEDGNLFLVEDLITDTNTLRQYNWQGKVVSETLANGLTVESVYNRLGQRTSFRLPDQSSLSYIYDNGFLKSIYRLSPSRERMYSHHYFSYLESGKPLEAEMIKGLGRCAWKWDEKECLIGIETPFFYESIQYDENGRVVQTTVFDVHGEEKKEYAYDALNQLIKESDSVYTYDSFFNRLSKNNQRFVIKNADQVIDDGERLYKYDLNGNLISEKDQEKTISYYYDALDRLIGIVVDDEVIATYCYDAFNRRVSQLTLDGEKYFIYDGDKEIGSTDAEGNIVELRVLGVGLGAEIGAAVALEIEGKTYLPISDHRGNIRALVDTDKRKVVETYRYDAFGNEQIFLQSDNQTSINPWRFSSKRKDKETGLISFGRRYYHSGLGRWITKDPLGNIDLPNLYAFVGNNPVNQIDLYGGFSISASWMAAWGFVQSSYEVMNRFLERLRRQTFIFHYYDDLFNRVMEDTMGHGWMLIFGNYIERPHVGVYYGNGECSDKVRVTMINGILTTRSMINRGATVMSYFHGGNSVHFVYRPTRGWTWDILTSILVKFGYVSSEAYRLAGKWRDLIEEMGGVGSGGTIVHYAHSVGGSETLRALSLMTEEEKKMIRVYCFGAPNFYPADLGCQLVINYASVRDGVTYLDPLGYFYAFMGWSSHTRLLGSVSEGLPLIDHPLYADNYRQILIELGSRFIEEFCENSH